MIPALTLTFVLASPVPPTQLETASHVRMRLETSITTRTARVGNPVFLRTVDPIAIDGAVVRPGSEARGRVVRATRPGRVRGTGELEIAVVSLVLPDGSVRPLQTRPVAPPARQLRSPTVRLRSPADPSLAI